MTTGADFAVAAVQLCEAIRTATSNPLSAVRNLSTLIAAPLPKVRSAAASGAQVAVSNMMHRAALGSIALACADYQPASSTEANAIINQVGDLFTNGITAAADAGDAQSFAALRDLRAAVVEDLRNRTAALPELVTVSLPGMLPSLVVAYRLYGDTRREPEMVARANVRHPGFMPGSFEALSS